MSSEFSGPDNTKIVCICGSMRFSDEMVKQSVKETLSGHIVLMPHVIKPEGLNPAVAEALDELHLKKMDMADEVIVITGDEGYVGKSTSHEIKYAELLRIPIRYVGKPPKEKT